MTTRTEGPDWFHTARPDAPPDVRPPALDAGDTEDPGDQDLLDDWAAPPRAGRLTKTLALGLLAAVVFTGGALVQKQFGGDTAASAGAAGGFPGGQVGGFPGGGAFPAGAFPGAAGQAGAQPGAQPRAQAGQGTASSGQAAGTGTSSAPAVVGTVTSVEGTDLVVENFAKKTVTVHVPETATVTTPGLTAVATGMTVTVVGAKAADGSVTATSVVARRSA
jgi:hypothetical protein